MPRWDPDQQQRTQQYKQGRRTYRVNDAFTEMVKGPWGGRFDETDSVRQPALLSDAFLRGKGWRVARVGLAPTVGGAWLLFTRQRSP